MGATGRQVPPSSVVSTGDGTSLSMVGPHGRHSGRSAPCITSSSQARYEDEDWGTGISLQSCIG